VHHEHSGDPKEAMVGSLAHSGRVIFAAGAVMVAVFFTFALSGPLPLRVPRRGRRSRLLEPTRLHKQGPWTHLVGRPPGKAGVLDL
jgi:hypothetical protein